MELFLAECLDSILMQTLSEIEIICINDGSTDTTPQILNAYRQRDARILIIDQQNQGVAVARNNGICKASGEYIAFMDPDDFYPNKDTLKTLYASAADHHALICGGSFSSFDNNTKRVSTYYPPDLAKYTFKEEGFVDYRDYQFDFGYHRFLYNRAFLLENGITFPLYRRFQDPPFFVRAMIAAGRFYAIPDIVYRYRCGIQAKSTSWPSIKLQDMMKGYRDNLTISAENQLCELHALTVRRFEADNVVLPVLQSLQSGNRDTFALLIQINQAIRPDLLKEAGMDLNATDGYILREFEEILRVFKGSYANEDVLAADIQASLSYRIGSAITFIPRKIRNAILCCRESGIVYTVKLAFQRILGKHTSEERTR